MKKIITVVLTLTLVITMWMGSGFSSQAKCTDWTVVSSSSSCDYSDSCGFLWLSPGTKYKTGTKERYCSKDGKQERETTYFSEKDGCCD